MTLVLGFDFETTGLEPKTDRIIEVGAVLWDWERATPLRIMSELVRHLGLELPDEITKLTGITSTDLVAHGLSLKTALAGLQDLIGVGSSRVDLQACKLEYSIVSPK